MDLTGGIEREREYVFAERPDDPEIRDSASFWVVDGGGTVALPRVGIEAVAANWEAHGLQMNVAFPDGRAYRLRADGPSWPPAGPDGRPTVLGAGPLVFRCVEPFDTWTMSFDGQAVQTSTFDLMEGRHDGPLVDVAFEVEAVMAAPPWIQGTLVAEAGAALATSVEGGLMGGPRYEQLFRAVGTVRVRRGVPGLQRDRGCAFVARACDAWPGSGATAGSRLCSRAGVPSGTSPTRRVTTGRRRSTRATCSTVAAKLLVAARVVSAPWLTELQALGQDVSFVFETEAGRVEDRG